MTMYNMFHHHHVWQPTLGMIHMHILLILTHISHVQCKHYKNHVWEFVTAYLGCKAQLSTHNWLRYRRDLTPSADRITGRLNKFSGELTNCCFLNGGLATAKLERHQGQNQNGATFTVTWQIWLLNLRNKAERTITWHLVRNKKGQVGNITQTYLNILRH